MAVAVKPKVTPPKVTPPKKQPERVKVTQDVPPVETAALDGNKVAAQYAAIGKKLVALGSAAEAMWVPYRNININDVMKNPAPLPETTRILAKLQSDIAAAEKAK